MAAAAAAEDSALADAVPEVVDSATGSDSTEVDFEIFTDSDESAPNSDDDGYSDATAAAPTGSESSDDFNPDTVDWLRVDLDTVPEQYKHLAPMAKNMQRGFTQQTQALAEQRRELANSQQQWANRVEQVATPPPQPTQFEQVRASLSPDDQKGLDVFRQQTYNDFGAPLQQLNQQVQQLQSQLAQATQFISTQQNSQVNDSVQEARSAYGADLDNYADQIVATVKIPNPQTGQPYTVKEAYELHAGVTAGKANQLRNQDRAARRSSKSRVKNTGSIEADMGGDGILTEADLFSQAEAIGFDPAMG